MTPTWLEIGFFGFIMGIFGYVVKALIANKMYVRKDMCNAKHTWLEETLRRIESKLDTLNGGKK